MAVPRFVVHMFIFVQSLILYYAILRLREAARYKHKLRNNYRFTEFLLIITNYTSDYYLSRIRT